MRFVSPKGRNDICIPEQWEILASGQPRTTKRGYTAVFRQGATAHDREVAVQHFRWNKQLDMAGREIDPVYAQDRVWVFDTKEIADEGLREQVEQILTSIPGFGQEFVLVEQAAPARPYPRYDEHRKIVGRRTIERVIMDITAAYEQVGFDIDEAIAYEEAQEHSSAEVVEILRGLRTVFPEEKAELVEA